MSTDNDPQRREELARQRGYGEAPGAKDKPLEDQPAASGSHSRAARGAGGKDASDRGFLRETDGLDVPSEEAAPGAEAEAPVTDPSDPRHPAAPETYGADTGPKEAETSSRRPLSTRQLDEAYSADDQETRDA